MLGVDFFIFDKLVPSHSNVPVTPIFENTLVAGLSKINTSLFILVLLGSLGLPSHTN